MTALNKPTSSEHKSVINFIESYEPLEAEDERFIYEKEDLITLRPGREHAWLDASVERLLRWFRFPLLAVSLQSSNTTAAPHSICAGFANLVCIWLR